MTTTSASAGTAAAMARAKGVAVAGEHQARREQAEDRAQLAEVARHQRIGRRRDRVLVTGATGRQGGATARALLAAGVPVRALVRDPSTDRPRSVAALGAELVTGDLDDRDSLVRAAQGARAVFSVQMPAMDGDTIDFDGELAQGVNLIEGALAAEVPQFVHTSVSPAPGSTTRRPAGPKAAGPRWSPSS